MKDNNYLLPGIAAIFVAILFPMAWFYEILSSLSGDYEIVFQFDISSIIFLVIGLATVFIYYSFMKLLHDHHNYRSADFALISMIIFNVIYYLGFFLLDVISPWSNTLIGITASTWAFFASIIIFGAIDVFISLTILMNYKDLPSQFKIFAIINLVLGILELTLFLSPVALILFPVVAIQMALIFLKKPEMIEIV